MTRDAQRPAPHTEIHATPEEVWELIATGPGISSWFMPATVEPRAGGAITQRHGVGDEMVSRGTITAYDPPRRLVYEEPYEGRTIATEFLVEAQSGGTCVVRVVTHGLTADDAGFAEGVASGWAQALATLRLRLEAFPSAPAGSARIWAQRSGTIDEAWHAALADVGVSAPVPGARVARADGSGPALTGEADTVLAHGLVVRVDGPQPGVLRLAATGFGGRTSVVLDRYIYGPGAQAAADAEVAAWQALLTEDRR